jgi:hypothetical protein
VQVERGEDFARGQAGLVEPALDAPGRALARFRLGQMQQQAPVAPVLGLGGGDHAGILFGHGGQPQRAQQQRQGIVLAHEATSCTCGSSNAS